ncbi:MAG TPA: 50S ribosomal protein L11 methyltransferase [Bryobacteraceae bacterium]|nr:50S ribosomal protein L11 methyltransferase [Bryobacteraceae bacterium]
MSDWLLLIDTDGADRDALIADLWEAGTTGITEEDTCVRAFFDGAADRTSILHRLAAWSPVLQEVEPHDWVQHSQSMWRPLEVGARFWLVPEWSEDGTPGNRIRLTMRAGMASGSGLHPATRLALMALERVVQPGSAVLDVGTGSGILADAARLLGARFIAACDIDHEASVEARANVPEAAIFTGSLRSVRSGGFDVVVANINVPTITTLASELARIAAPAVVVTGFREEEIASAAKTLPRTVKETLELEGWACLIC